MLKFKTSIIVILVLSILASSIPLAGCQNNPSSSSSYDKTIELARTAFWKNINNGVNSASVAIIDNGRIVYSEGFGIADRENNIPVSNNTLYNVGSVGKIFCTTAVMLLVDAGKIKLDDPVVKYLPEFSMADARYKDISIRMLLNHTSGLPGSTLANSFGFEYNADFYNQLLTTLANSHLRAAPGEFASYCNDGFSLAEMVVSRVSGKKYDAFVSEKIFKPLGMKNTGLSVGLRPEQQYAAYYQTTSGSKEPPEAISSWGAGGLSSTPEDLCRFADSFCDKGTHILSQTAINEMNRAQASLLAGKTEKDPEMSFGLGWDITEAPAFTSKGIKVVGKGGDTFHYHSYLLTSPNQRLAVAISQSGASPDMIPLSQSILSSLLEQKGLLPAAETTAVKPVVPQSIPAQYAAFEGYYGPSPSKLVVDMSKQSVTFFMLIGAMEIPAMNFHYRDGYFYDEQGRNYYLLSVEGKYYLAGSSFNDSIRMIIAQKLTVPEHVLSLSTNIDGKMWLRRNVKRFDGISDDATHIVTSRYIKELPGYVDFSGMKIIQADNFAGMPIGAISGQTELTLMNKNGQVWARVSDIVYSQDDMAATLKDGTNQASIGSEGLNEWFKAGAGAVLSFKIPDAGRVIVFSAGGAPVYDSAVDKQSVYVTAGSLVEIAGNPGDIFTVTANLAN
jgi:CubicO group peptidase (beta-lactamase class C family)